MADDFEIRALNDAGTPVLEIVGELDLSKGSELADQLTRLESEHPAITVVDLSAVTFLDSTALGVLVRAQQRARELGCELRLVVDRPHILKVFDITGLDAVFAIYTTRAEALT